jgi:5'-phosphate synthase pdxT subunit
VETLASSQGQPVLVRQGQILIATFHPELTSASTVHEYFLRIASEKIDSANKVLTRDNF